MEKVLITEVCDIFVGRTPSRYNPFYWGTGFPWLSIADMNQGESLSSTKETITTEAVKECKCKIVPKGTVLFSFKLSIGKVGITAVDMFTNEAIAAFLIKDKSRLDTKFLFYTLKSTDYSVGSNKAVMGKTLNKEQLKKFTIPLPPIEDQRRIVKILDQAQSLIEKRKQAITLLDDYIKAVFLDMFGDPVSNPKGWERVKFANFGTLDRGKSKHRPRNAPELLGGEHPLIQTGDIANSKLFIENYVSTYSDIGLKQSKKWPKGTLCITIAANIAKTGILAFDACFPDSVVGFIANPEKTNSIFIHYWISFFQKILEDNAPESAQKNINLKILRDLEVINPPKEVQDKFAVTVQEIVSVKQKMQSQLKELADNFQVQLQRAFKGE